MGSVRLDGARRGDIEWGVGRRASVGESRGHIVMRQTDREERAERMGEER